MAHRHDHPTACALYRELKVLEKRVADWAAAKERRPGEVDAVIANAVKRINRASLIGSANAPVT